MSNDKFDGFDGDDIHRNRDANESDDGFGHSEAHGPENASSTHGDSTTSEEFEPGPRDQSGNQSGTGDHSPTADPVVTLLGGPSADFIDVESRVRPALDMEKILAALRVDADFQKNDSDYVFNHGPLETFAHQINENLKNICDIAPIAEAFQAHVNHAFHLAVAEHYTALFTPEGAPRLENSEAGLDARLMVLERAIVHYEQLAMPLAGDLAKAGYRSQEMIESVRRAVTFERERIEKMKETLGPPTIGESIFNSLKETAGKLFANGDVAGDVRDYQNRKIKASLLALRDIGVEIRHNAGNRGWIGTHGQRAMAESERLQKGLKELTEGMGTKLNHRAIKTQLDEITDIFASASLVVDDEEFKKKLKSFVESIVAMVERMTSAVQRRFSAFGAPSPGA